MNTMRRLFALGLLLCSLTACNRDDLQLPGAVEETSNDDANRKPQDPYVVSADVAKTGSAVDEHGAIATPKSAFAPNETVFLSIDAKGRRQGDRVHVYWFHEDGTSRKDEEKILEGPYVYFEFQSAEAGKFHAEVDINERPVGLTDFEVK